MDILDLKDYGTEKGCRYVSVIFDYFIKFGLYLLKRGYRYVSVIFDYFIKFGWTNQLKNKNAQTKKESLENILIGSKRSPNLIQTDQGKKFHNNCFQNFLNKNEIKLHSRKTSLGAVFVEKYNRLFRDLLKRPVF